jgi:Zn-dependent peptidase ImmA (M78 family)/DNA-binding XRE family transcriptional regulator
MTDSLFPPPENVFGTRLRFARKKAGLSLQELADVLQNKISKQSLNKYEAGLMKPSTEILLALTKALNVSTDYLLREESVELKNLSFRKYSGLKKKDEEAIIEKARDYIDRFNEIENILGISNDFVNPIGNLEIKSFDDVELAAKLLREKWELGVNPISNVINMLELAGIKVYLIKDVDKFDGFAVYTSGIPIVVVNIATKSVERIRFTGIHELAHILLKFNDTISNDESLIEQYCHYFASCFLIPKQMLIKMIGNSQRNYIEINELITIKEYYGISIRAIVHRLNKIGVITPTYYKRWSVWLSREFGKKGEPGKFKGEEKMQKIVQLVSMALAEGIISVSKAASICNCSVEEFRKGEFDVS